MIFWEGLTRPCFLLRGGQGGVGPEGMGGAQTQGQEGERCHVEAAVVGVPVGNVRLSASKANGQVAPLVEVLFAIEHTVHDHGERVAHLTVGETRGQ